MEEKDLAKCFVVSAPSGAGKTTLMHKLIDDKPGVFYNSISDTTRDSRSGEVHGRDYNFISVPEFQSRLEGGNYLEWAEVHDNFYGTPRIPFFDAMRDGMHPMMILDVQGYLQMRDKVPYDKLCSIFVFPPAEEELIRRINARGEMDEETLRVRLENSKKECAVAPEYKYALTNDDFDTAYSILKFIVEKEMEF